MGITVDMQNSSNNNGGDSAKRNYLLGLKCFIRRNSILVKREGTEQLAKKLSFIGVIAKLELQLDLEHIFLLELLLESKQDQLLLCHSLLCTTCLSVPFCWECLSLHLHLHWRRGRTITKVHNFDQVVNI